MNDQSSIESLIESLPMLLETPERLARDSVSLEEALYRVITHPKVKSFRLQKRVFLDLVGYRIDVTLAGKDAISYMVDYVPMGPHHLRVHLLELLSDIEKDRVEYNVQE